MPASSSDSLAISAVFSRCLALTSRGNQSFIKFMSVTSRQPGVSGVRLWGHRLRRRERAPLRRCAACGVRLRLTLIGQQHCLRSTQRTVVLAPLLHLDETADAEEVPARQADGLERDRHADEARVVVERRQDSGVSGLLPLSQFKLSGSQAGGTHGRSVFVISASSTCGKLVL